MVSADSERDSVRDKTLSRCVRCRKAYGKKEMLPDGPWVHEKIILSLDERDFEDIVIENVREQQKSERKRRIIVALRRNYQEIENNYKNKIEHIGERDSSGVGNILII